MTNYEQFLKSKQIMIEPSGFTPDALNPALFEFQRDIDRWALERGRTAVFADCGLGKSFIQLVWAEHVTRKLNKPVLILAPLAVSKQTVREGQKFGIDAKLAASAMDVKKTGIYVTNYEKIGHFDPSRFGGVVPDECFPAGTMVDTLSGMRDIKTIHAGDLVWNANGVDMVIATKKRRLNNAVRIKLKNGETIIASENHPFFTRGGYVVASELRPNDALVETEAAMRLVRGGCDPATHTRGVEAVLQSILLREMAHGPAILSGESSHRGSKSKERYQALAVVAERIGRCADRDRTYPQTESDERSRSATESQFGLALDGTQAQSARRQRERYDETTKTVVIGAPDWVGAGSSDFFRLSATRLSALLQGGYREQRFADRYRSGWILPPLSEGSRQKEGRETGFIRVDCVEVLEQGHPELEKLRDADGSLYFYDIQASRHPSFSVAGCLVHNSSILKSFTGATRNILIDRFRHTPMKLCCTATPAPNDFMELGNHSEFLGVLTRTEMLSTFFVHDGGDTSKWRLKGHAEEEYWKWICQWAVMIRKPSDLGYSDDGFELPPLTYHSHVVATNKALDGFLFQVEAQTLEERRGARRDSLSERVQVTADMVNGSTEPWLIWCDLNAEGDALTKAIPDAVQVAGADTDEQKESRMLGFADGQFRVLVTKPSIAGYGMNWQHCPNTAFVGLSDSWEKWYQAIRRVWRFGQKKPVHCHVVTSEAEGAVVKNIQRKEADAARMAAEMVKHMSVYNTEAIHTKSVRTAVDYKTNEEKGDGWTMRLGDCVERVREIADNTIHYSLFSPPFIALYTYSASDRDMGNARNDEEFYEHFNFLITELLSRDHAGEVALFSLYGHPRNERTRWVHRHQGLSG